MSYEISLLKTATKFPQHRRAIQNISLAMALNSFDPLNDVGQSPEQLQNVVRMLELMDLLEENYFSICHALTKIGKGYGSLLVQFYTKRDSALAMAKRYRVSAPTVYRKLRIAKNKFCKELRKIGVTDSWYNNTFLPKMEEYGNMAVPSAFLN